MPTWHEEPRGIANTPTCNANIANGQFLPLIPFGLLVLITTLLSYLFRINHLLKGTPAEVRRLSSERWTPELLSKAYNNLGRCSVDYNDELPPKLNRRYMVTGGNGLVGGYIILQLLARGTPPKSIRIIDIRKTERDDMLAGQATLVDFIQTDIVSKPSVDKAFSKPWEPSIAHLPLTVFHTAAVIIPSARSKHLYKFPEAVNVQGTKNILAASRAAGADIFSSTSSASISIRPVKVFTSPWARHLPHYWQILDDQDFFKPLRRHEEYFGNYPFSKAVAERLVCAENESSFRTGCIRPANGVYGNPTDNPVGSLLVNKAHPTWIPHIVQNFAHGANVAIAHLHHEAVLAGDYCPQAGKPFVVTDPGPPITYGDLYTAIEVLSIRPFRTITLPPIVVLIVSIIIEWYILLPYRFPYIKQFIPEVKGDVKKLQPGLFSICTHLIASDGEARKPITDGGLGYKGVLTTMQGVVMEIMAWNQEQVNEQNGGEKKAYTSSVSLGERIQQLGADTLS
ncbi:hypothetical protein FSARC_1060 [Fusarium sarcochroum]|uniref:3-beta hydroxysteroid dehydrogenase/isomerase domain-containing protein n=1 Tax=Fusarium sarcochroum TaxID=1208366 RepID=A0A8H4UAE2_9HYPO|nr:hypothetical protein FSARC_1060 [Fusarium sarcochroum]